MSDFWCLSEQDFSALKIEKMLGMLLFWNLIVHYFCLNCTDSTLQADHGTDQVYVIVTVHFIWAQQQNLVDKKGS
jgi:hypothetical protein